MHQRIIHSVGTVVQLTLAGTMLTSCAALVGQAINAPISTLRPNAVRHARLTMKPRRLVFTHGRSQGASVDILGGQPPFRITQSHPEVAWISKPRRITGAWRFNVLPLASGQSTITVRTAGATSSLVVRETAVCEPPVPNFWLVYPNDRSGGKVSRSTGRIWMAASTAYSDQIPDFFVHLVGSDGNALLGTHFAFTTASPPPGSDRAPAQDAVNSVATIPVLKRGVTYTVQFASKVLQCLPPAFVGRFTTRA